MIKVKRIVTDQNDVDKALGQGRGAGASIIKVNRVASKIKSKVVKPVITVPKVSVPITDKDEPSVNDGIIEVKVKHEITDDDLMSLSKNLTKVSMPTPEPFENVVHFEDPVVAPVVLAPVPEPESKRFDKGEVMSIRFNLEQLRRLDIEIAAHNLEALLVESEESKVQLESRILNQELQIKIHELQAKINNLSQVKKQHLDKKNESVKAKVVAMKEYTDLQRALAEKHKIDWKTTSFDPETGLIGFIG